VRTLRKAGRLAVLLGGSAAAIAHFTWLCARRRRLPSLHERAAWLHGWCAWGLPRLGVRLACHGAAPRRGLIVANHLSYLDILTLSTAVPAVFVAKKEVRSWPLFGWMGRLGGTIFLERERLRDLPRALREMEAALEAGVPVVLFPESTTTNGNTLLPFRSPLFEAAVRTRRRVTPLRLAYSLTEGNAADEVCWWGDMALADHLLNLLGKPQVEAAVRFAEGRRHYHRKLAALVTRATVLALAVEPAPAASAPESQPQAAVAAVATSSFLLGR
jgi:1-acyl-sn-glycerol-3-phosphate acyltransferase